MLKTTDILLGKIKNIYSLNATLLRQRAYNEGRSAAARGKTVKDCPYDILSSRVTRDIWLQGFDNYNYERELKIEEYKSLA